MSRYNKYKEYAAACIEIAQATKSWETRAVWVTMAMYWVRLADQSDDMAMRYGEGSPAREAPTRGAHLNWVSTF